MQQNKFILPLEWKKQGSKNCLFAGEQRVGYYERVGDEWKMSAVFFSKKIAYYPASEPDIVQWVESNCNNELSSVMIDVDSFLEQYSDKVYKYLLSKIKNGIKFIDGGTKDSPGEFKKAYTRNSEDYESREAISHYRENLFKRIDELLNSLERQHFN